MSEKENLVGAQLELCVEKLDKYKKFAEKCFSEPNKVAFKRFLEDFEERLLLCPASQKDDLHLSHPGGLLIHSLNVLNMFSYLFLRESTSTDVEPVATVSLLHDIGKLGTIKEEYFIPITHNWKNYEINDKLRDMTITQRTLKMILDYRFELTDEEFSAISNAYFFVEQKESYFNSWNLPDLAAQLSVSKMLAIRKEKR